LDGNGARVKSVMTTTQGSTITYFVSNYEVTNGVVTKYYGVYPEPSRRAGGQRIAMRSNGTLNYLIGDHPSINSGHRLGSTSLVTDASGNVVTS